MTPTQKARFIGIKTALGPDKLVLNSFSVTEELSCLFQIEAELSSEDGQVDFDKLVGHNATIRLDIGQNSKRYFNGIVSRLVQVANRGGFARYRAIIVPWLWLLTRTSDCRIFQKKSTPEIIEEVFKGHGFSDYKLKLSDTYAKREYCVQYRETDFNFVSRLMEAEGIYYFIEHEEDKHILVLADAISAHKAFPNYAEVSFLELEKGATGREGVTDWTVEKELQPVAYALNDFDFKKPKASLRMNSNVTRKYGQAQFEVYDYPGEYVEAGDGERLTQARLDELQSRCELRQGQASARGLATGATFKLKGHPRDDQNREFLITETSIHADSGEFATGGGGNEGDFFSCTFTAMDKAQQFRPERQTPKPIVQGMQTAMVVGPSGETIHCDEFGRIKVQFHWDRHAKGDDNASCWIRVSQPWGGKNWGGMFIPHVGQEVVVSFEEGDPDRPLITGRVYNPDQMPPVALPAGKTQSVIRDHGNNQIIMEGKAGEEFMQLKQAYGNEIKLDAKAKTMRFYCPTHLTELVMGKSINWSTASEWIQKVGGNLKTEVFGDVNWEGKRNNTETFIGRKHDTVIGARTEMTFGTKSEINAVSQNVVVLGVLCEFFKGWKIDLNKAGRKNKTSELMDLIEDHKEFTKKREEKMDKQIVKVADTMMKIEKSRVEYGEGKIDAKKYDMKVKKLDQKMDKLNSKCDNAVMDYKSAKMLCDTLKLC